MTKNILYISLLLLLISCVEKNIQPEELNIIENTNVDSNTRFWLGNEVKLPKGLVVKMDHAHAKNGETDDDLTNNYVTIKTESGNLTIIRDVDVDTYLNVYVGDLIK